jgi:prepilin-type N-terminal cleavage/methylation domain-containing protein
MRRLIVKVSGRLRGEDGFTLVEVLTASVLGLLVVGIATTVFVAAVKSQPNLTTRGNSVSTARVTAERLVRELRQGRTVYTATASSLSFLTHLYNQSCGSASGGFCRVTYTCSPSGSCTRVQARPDGSGAGTAATVISGLANGNVFSYLTGAGGTNYVTITLQFPPINGGTGVKVTDGAALRNAPSS